MAGKLWWNLASKKWECPEGEFWVAKKGNVLLLMPRKKPLKVTHCR